LADAVFVSLQNQLQLARANRLRLIADDLVARISKLDGEPLYRFAHVVAVEIDDVLTKTHNFKNVSKDGLKHIANGYVADAQRTYVLDGAASIGKSLVATLLEASALPGDDARYVRELTEGVAAMAIKRYVQLAPN
jgi:hypothetical protein